MCVYVLFMHNFDFGLNFLEIEVFVFVYPCRQIVSYTVINKLHRAMSIDIFVNLICDDITMN